MKQTWLVVLLSAAIAAGCGGSSPTSQSKTPSNSGATPGASAGAGGSPSDCSGLGIDPTGMREGTCTHGGVTWTIVDEDHTLKLSSLWAKLAGIRTSKGLASGTSSTTATGRFLIASVTITNKLPAPQTFDQSHTQQAGLILEGALFKEAVDVEHAADQNSCLKRTIAPVPSGQSVTCDVIFEVPTAAAADLGKHASGDLYLVNFGSDLSGSVFPQRVGQIRLYH